MSISVEGLRIAYADANEQLVIDMAEREEAQLKLAEAHTNLEAKQIAVKSRDRQIADLQTDIEEAEALITGPDEPTNIPELPDPVDLEPGIEPVVCAECGRERTAEDEDYSPLQVIQGQPIGWYSAEDAEICGQCMTNTIEGETNE